MRSHSTNSEGLTVHYQPIRRSSGGLMRSALLISRLSDFVEE
jgi:hypothetical protein